MLLPNNHPFALFPSLFLADDKVLSGPSIHYNLPLDEFRLDEQERAVVEAEERQECVGSGITGCKDKVLRMTAQLSHEMRDLIKARLDSVQGMEELAELHRQTIAFYDIYYETQTKQAAQIEADYKKNHAVCGAEQCLHDLQCEMAHHFGLMDLDEAMACIKRGALFDNRNLTHRHMLLGNALGDELMARAREILEHAATAGVTISEEEEHIGTLLSRMLEGTRAPFEGRTFLRNHLIMAYDSSKDTSSELRILTRHAISRLLGEHLSFHMDVLSYSIESLYWSMRVGDEWALKAMVPNHQMMAVVREKRGPGDRRGRVSS